MSLRTLIICIAWLICAISYSKPTDPIFYQTDTIQTYFDTLVGKRIFPIEINDSTFQLAKKKQLYCCCDVKGILFVVMNTTCLDIDSQLVGVGYNGRDTLLQRLNLLHPHKYYIGKLQGDLEYKFYNQLDTLYYWLQWDPDSPTFIDLETNSEWCLGWYHITSSYFPVGKLRCRMRYTKVLSLLGIDEYIATYYKKIVILPKESVKDVWFYTWDTTCYFNYSCYCNILTFEKGHLISIKAGEFLFPNSAFWNKF